MRNINLWTYAANTPIEDWFSTDELFTSQYLNSHISDFLRYLSLYKFGGTYLDLDVVVQKTFENLTANYAGAESPNFVAAGVINFQHDGIGHEIADMCVRYVYCFHLIVFFLDHADLNSPNLKEKKLNKFQHFVTFNNAENFHKILMEMIGETMDPVRVSPFSL